MSLYLVAGVGASTDAATPHDHLPSARTRRYPSDTTDAEWVILAPLVPVGGPGPHGGRPPLHSRRDIIDAIRYVTHNGGVWSALPADFPPWKTVHDQSADLQRPGCLMGFWGQVRNGLSGGWHDFASPYVSMYNGFRTNPGRTSLNMVIGLGVMATPIGQAQVAWESAKTAGKFANAVYRGDMQGVTRVATERALTVGAALVPFGAGRLAAVARAGRGAAALEGGGLFRRGGNTGPFAGLKVPMQKRVVTDTARRAGVDMVGVRTSINRQDELIGKDLYGHTPNGRRITLYPDAFKGMESLVKTLGHERTHIMQYRLYGPTADTKEIRIREDAAYDVEDQFWTEYNNGH